MSVATKNTLTYLWNKVLILYNKLSTRITALENSSGSGGGGTYYGICTTSGSTAAKVVTCDGFVLKEGVEINVYFNESVPNMVTPITLNVNGTGAKTVYFQGGSTTASYKIMPYSVCKFIYDGTYYRVVGFPNYSVSDSSSASSFSKSEYLVTERDVYYGTPTINGSKSYNSNTNIYAPTSTGTSGQILKSTGSGAPVWVDIISVEELEPDANTNEITADGATIDTGYVKPHIKKTKIKLGSNIIVFSEYIFGLTNITNASVDIKFNNTKFTKYQGVGCITAYTSGGLPVKIHLNYGARVGDFVLYFIDGKPYSTAEVVAIKISTTYLGVE